MKWKGRDMTIQKSGSSVRKAFTRALASGVLLSMYGLGLVATTGAVMTAGVTPAHAQRGRGRGRGRGWGGPGVGAAIGLGIGAAMIGGAIAASEAERSNRVNYCLQRYRSYDPGSGTYLGRDGLRHPCP